MTRFRVLDLALGWLKLTVSCPAMEKPSQLRAAFWELWLMSVTGPVWAISAAPLVTCPP
jgi:hypothetical protein